MSNKIDKSNLTIIDQDIGGYHPCFKPPKSYHCCYHYDSFGEDGSLYAIKDTHPIEYQKYLMLFEGILNTKINNRQDYWDQIKNSSANEISYRPAPKRTN
jgi:hypothetical protein